MVLFAQRLSSKYKYNFCEVAFSLIPASIYLGLNHVQWPEFALCVSSVGLACIASAQLAASAQISIEIDYGFYGFTAAAFNRLIFRTYPNIHRNGLGRCKSCRMIHASVGSADDCDHINATIYYAITFQPCTTSDIPFFWYLDCLSSTLMSVLNG